MHKSSAEKIIPGPLENNGLGLNGLGSTCQVTSCFKLLWLCKTVIMATNEAEKYIFVCIYILYKTRLS